VKQLPEIPGGWAAREIVVDRRNFRLTLPASPDAFLDDPAVRAASERDDYMPYWPYLWPAALSMAEAVARADWPAGTEVLEIGAGIGFVGLVALSRLRRDVDRLSASRGRSAFTTR
jgi:predicted nicotinamide N-methyase